MPSPEEEVIVFYNSFIDYAISRGLSMPMTFLNSSKVFPLAPIAAKANAKYIEAGENIRF